MFDTTPAVARALESARHWAAHDRSPTVQPAHVLQGLIEEEEGRAWMLLIQAGVDPQRVRRPALPDEAVPLEEPPPDPATREALIRARELARGLGEELSVASEHLLLALIETSAALRQSLEAHGLRFEQLEGSVLAAQGPPIRLEEPLLLDEPEDRWHAARILD